MVYYCHYDYVVKMCLSGKFNGLYERVYKTYSDAKKYMDENPDDKLAICRIDVNWNRCIGDREGLLSRIIPIYIKPIYLPLTEEDV